MNQYGAYQLAAIFGENELDDAATGEGEYATAVPNNCSLFERLSTRTPSTGRIAKIGPSGSKSYLATGETFIRDDIVISAAHIVTENTPESDDELIFEVYEPSRDGCHIATYRIEHYRVLTLTPFIPRCAHLDIALFQLQRGVAMYRPLELAPADLVEEFKTGWVAATKFGFADHPSTDFGRVWSITTTTAKPVVRHDPSCRNENLFAYDGDAWSGESGAVFRIDGKIVGIHVRGFDREFDTYSTSTANIGALIGFEARQEIDKIIHELDENQTGQ